MRQRLFNSLAVLVILALLSLPASSFGMEKGGAAPVDNPALQVTLSYEGASSIAYTLMPKLAKAFLDKSGIAFGNIGEAGATAGFKAVTEGKVSMAGMPRHMSDSEKAAVAAWQVIGFDALGAYVHPSNPVKSLTRAQLKDIFSGKITNWRDVGGANRPIVVITERLNSGRGTLAVVKDIILDGGKYGPVREREDPMDCMRAVEDNHGGITFATTSIASRKAKNIAVDGILPERARVASGEYLLSRPLLLITMMPSGNVQRFFEFVMTPEGQAIVGQVFVSAK